MRLHTAVTMGVEHCTNAKSKARMATAAKSFLLFAQCRGVKDWQDLSTGILREYTVWLSERDICPRTVRNYLNAVRLAARYVEDYHPDQRIELSFRRVVPSLDDPPKRYLSRTRLREAMFAADSTAKYALYTGALCGLRLQEAASLRAADLDGATLTIRDSKNQHSNRVIPITLEAAGYIGAFLMIHRPLKTFETLGKALHRLLESLPGETYRMLQPHDCGRKTFANLAVQSAVPLEYLRAYMGHAPVTVAERHYLDLRARPDDMPDLRASKIARLRVEVIDRIAY